MYISGRIPEKIVDISWPWKVVELYDRYSFVIYVCVIQEIFHLDYTRTVTSYQNLVPGITVVHYPRLRSSFVK